jgi:hypothetical protein
MSCVVGKEEGVEGERSKRRKIRGLVLKYKKFQLIGVISSDPVRHPPEEHR